MKRSVLLLALVAAAACRPFWNRGGGPAPATAVRDTLPLLPAQTIVVERAVPPAVVDTGRRISVRAIDADARALLAGIAREAGINLVVSADVNRRVTLTLTDVPAMVAIREIVQAAGLTLESPGDRGGALPAVVFYQLPVNINRASAETIAARFDVSLELARWIVEARRP